MGSRRSLNLGAIKYNVMSKAASLKIQGERMKESIKLLRTKEKRMNETLQKLNELRASQKSEDPVKKMRRIAPKLVPAPLARTPVKKMRRIAPKLVPAPLAVVRSKDEDEDEDEGSEDDDDYESDTCSDDGERMQTEDQREGESTEQYEWRITKSEGGPGGALAAHIAEGALGGKTGLELLDLVGKKKDQSKEWMDQYIPRDMHSPTPEWMEKNADAYKHDALGDYDDLGFDIGRGAI
jgi:hypothetical protein